MKENQNIRIKNLRLAYHKSSEPENELQFFQDFVLDSISQSFHRGKVYGILGFTGSGKSTFLREIAGLNKGEGIFREGEVEIPENWKYSYVFQQPLTSFNSFLSIKEHLKETFGKGKLNQRQERKINYYLDRYNLPSLHHSKIHDKPSRYSIGELQRILWVIALARNSHILLLDEALAHVDSGNAQLFLEDVQKYAEQGGIVLMATHLRKHLKEISDRVFLLENGKLKQYQYEEIEISIHKDDIVKDDVLMEVKELSFFRDSTTFNRSGKCIFEGISFSLRKNEILGISGESGAGKSTLAKILAGRLKQSSGSVEIDGIPIRDMERFQRSKKVQYLPQDPVSALPLNKSVKQYLNEITELHRVKDEYLAFLNELIPQLTQISSLKIHQLSGGQRQIILFYSALIVKSDVLIIDESFSAMDPQVFYDLTDFLIKWQELQNNAIILITHQSEVLNSMCTKTFSIKNLYSV